MCRHMYDWNIVNCDVKTTNSPHRRQRMSKNWENRPTLAHIRPTSAPILAIFWSADDCIVEAGAPKLKVSLTDPPFFRCFVIGEALADGLPIIGRQSVDDPQTVGRWFFFIKEPSARNRRISVVMIVRLSADHKLWFVLYCLQCSCPHYLWN